MAAVQHIICLVKLELNWILWYRKCLKASSCALSDTPAGKIVTLMSVDAQKVQDACLSIHALWGSPIMVGAILFFLYEYVGWATFVGLVVMASLGPIAGRLSRVIGKLQRERVGWTDKRVGLVNEVITGMRVIKFYAWEASFIERIQEYRNKEGTILKKLSVTFGLFSMLLFTGPVFVAVSCFSSYALAGNTLSTADAYSALAFFTILRAPLSFLPMFVTNAINAVVGLKRIQGFLLKPEIEERTKDEDVPVGVVEVRDGKFKWDTRSEEPTLRDVSFRAIPGTLTMVVGSVGSGKTSLLASLLRQTERISGSVQIRGRIAYVSQSAWIINDTVRENIILGAHFDEARYNQALETSQLMDDLAMWAKGDMTEIGERGITMSGGQKQRVSIARAVYSDADIFLLDDPLSAVDAHVGKALFDTCFTSVLTKKTIILVSNTIHFLPRADHILWLEDHTIKAQGSYKDIMASGFNPNDLGESVNVDLVVSPDVESIAPVRSIGNLSKSAKFEAVAEVEEEDAMHVEGMYEGSEEREESLSETASVSAVDSSPTLRAQDSPTQLDQGIPSPLSYTAQDVGKDNGENNMKKNSFDVKIPIEKECESKNEGKRFDKGGELTGIEERADGGIGIEVIGKYTYAIGGGLVVLLLIILFAFEQSAKISTDRWLGLWAEDRLNLQLGAYVGTYAAMGVAFGFFVFARSVHFSRSHVEGALQLHKWLLDHLLKLPMNFFDTNPSGRIVNRFSRDTDILDNQLAQTIAQFLTCCATFLGILVVISLATPLFVPILLPIALFYYYIQRYYIPSGRELQRLESTTRSPIYTHFGETINGAATIQAYNISDHFIGLSDRQIERNAAAFSTQKAASGWLSTRLDVIGLVTLMSAALLAVRGDISPALAGLSLVYALDMTKFLKFGTQTASLTESNFNSVERMVQYLKPDIEGNKDIESGTSPEAKLPENWPSQGAIRITNMSMRYRPQTPLVIRNLFLDIKPGEKVGIAGRTGSGKSSLFLALYRMVELEEGGVEIDGVDTANLKLSTLRSSMSMIPQDPFMFSGTIRLNLDPFDLHGDAELWKALEGVGLKETIENLDEKLGAPVVDNGANFSQGQRQLFCLARALLRKSKILMMDEATASVDIESDALIQRTIRENMQDTTVLTIAHRIHTIMDSDRVLVMDNGQISEFDAPQTLLTQKNSLFRHLVKSSQKSGKKLLGKSSFNMDPKTAADRSDDELQLDEDSGTLQKSASTIGLTGATAVKAAFDGANNN